MNGVEETTSPSDREVLWRQYALHVDLYKFYLTYTIKTVIFFYAATGAIVSFVLTRADLTYARWGLMLPIMMSFTLAGLYFYSSRLVDVVRIEVFEIRDALGLRTAPEMKVLQVILCVFGCLNTLIGVACVVLMGRGAAA